MKLKIHQRTTNDKFDILAGDIGATKTNLGIYHWDGTSLTEKKTAGFKTNKFLDINSLIGAFMEKEKMPDRVCLAVAGPVKDGKVTLTNNGWELRDSEISKYYKQVPVTLINDLEATAYGLAVKDDKNIHVLHEGIPDPHGNMAIIAPGTGLGEAGLCYDTDGYHPFATEGGHCDFAPRTDVDVELYHFLKKKFGHVSWERIVSGPGICQIFDFLHLEKERETPVWLIEKTLSHDKAATISEHAADCAICKETIELFLHYLAVESASLVLKLKATGGLFIGGGIIPHLLPQLHESNFIKSFTSAGRMKNLLQSVPVLLIMNEKTPLIGAASYGVHNSK
jgi:glucokinase